MPRIRLMFIIVLIACLALPAARGWAQDQPAADLHGDPRVKPGASFFLEFPELPVDRHGDVSKMQVIIPKSYDTKKLFPMIAWMGGGDGGSGAGGGAMIDPNIYVSVGMPFMKGATSQRQGNLVGDFPNMWKYHKHMLDELHRVVPNISPCLRVISGFSNGAHTTIGYMGLAQTDFPNYFTVYIPGDGSLIGYEMGGNFSHLAGRRLFVVWGEKSPNKGGSTGLVAAATRSGMKVSTFEEPNGGHEFNEEAQQKAAAWLKDPVMTELLAQAIGAMEKSTTGPALARSFSIAKSVEVLAPGTPSEAKFGDLLAKMEATIKADFDKLKSRSDAAATLTEKKIAIDALKTFLHNYRLAAVGDDCRELLSALGKPEFDKLTASLAKEMTAPQRLTAAAPIRKFAKDWELTAPGDDALTLLNSLAEKTLDELKAELPEKSTPAQRDAVVVKMRKFLTDWADTRTADHGLQFLADIGRLMLADMKAAWPKDMTAAQRDTEAGKLFRFRDTWKTTLAAADATAMLGELGEQEVEAFHTTWPATPTPAQKKFITDRLRQLQAKWEATSAAEMCDKLMKDVNGG